MHLTLEISNPQELKKILQYLQLLHSVRIVKQSVVPVERNDQPTLKKDFSRYWGSIKTNQTVESVEKQLNQLRSEWSRDIY